MANLIVVLAGAVLLSWPAILNGYPLVFSDTGGFLEQALMPDMGWDKPWIYGPLLTPFHLRLSLWGAMAMQVVVLSALLWVVQCVLRGPDARGGKSAHLVLCAVLAVGTAAPWFATLMMPDIFAPIAVLGLVAISFNNGQLGRWAIAWVGVVTTLAIASHLAHLVLAAGCVVAIGLVRWRWPWRAALPLLAALMLLVGTNVVGLGRVAVSPYGSVMALARLVADGPARDVIRAECPASGWRLCGWVGRLPTDSDVFLWAPYGPVWADGFGPTRLAPEAQAIVRRTLLAEPGRVLLNAMRRTFDELWLTRVGDTLGPEWLDVTVLPRLRSYFPAAEAARFQAGLQARNALRPLARPFDALQAGLLILGALGTLTVALRWRRDARLAGFAVVVLVALLANAASTGALSHLHDRYQARIAWLVVLPPFLALAAARRRG